METLLQSRAVTRPLVLWSFSARFISLRNLVLHSVIRMVAVRYRIIARKIIRPNLKESKRSLGGNQGKYIPDVELDTEVDDGDGDIDKGRYDGKHQVLEEVVDGTGSPIHHPQHLPGLAGQVPLQAKLVDVPEQGDLKIWLKGHIHD